MTYCRQCGQPIQDDERFCRQCGAPADGTDTGGDASAPPPSSGGGPAITVVGYKEVFAAQPSVKISINGQRVGEVATNGKTDIPIPGPCTVVFKCAFRSTKCQVNGGEWIVLSINRMTGGIHATVTDQQNHLNAIRQNQTSDNKRWIWIGVALGIMFLLRLWLKSIRN